MGLNLDRIYLQDDVDRPDDEVTWCQDRIDDTDTEYVRADINAAALARVAKLEAALREIMTLYPEVDLHWHTPPTAWEIARAALRQARGEESQTTRSDRDTPAI